MSEVKRSEETISEKKICRENDKFRAIISSGSNNVRFACIGSGEYFDIKKEHFPDFAEITQAVRNELTPQKKDVSADATETNKIKFTTVIDGKTHECYGWLKNHPFGGLILGISENKDNPSSWRLLKINKQGRLNLMSSFICEGISTNSVGWINFVSDYLQPPPAPKPLITAADWRDYFTNEADMMSYNVERAKAEFDNRIKRSLKTFFVKGKAETANYISMKKWMSIANGNKNYACYDMIEKGFSSVACGYCFAFHNNNKRCDNCIYKKIYCNDYSCDTAEPDEMLRRFQSPELLAKIKEYDEK